MATPSEKLRVLRRLPEVVFDEEPQGYNKHQVDKVLDRLAPLADEVDVLVERLGEAERRAAAAEARLLEKGGPAPTPQVVAEAMPSGDFDETLSKTLLLAQRTADATVKEAEEAAAALRAEVEAEAKAARDAAEAQSAQMLADAQAERDAAAERARTDVEEMVAKAKADLAERVAAAEAELRDAHEGRRADLVAQIEELEQSRDALSGDVELFEGYLASRRDTIREALAELSSVVEDPGKLRTAMPPTPVEVDSVEGIADEPIQVSVASIDHLGEGIVAERAAEPDVELLWADEADGHEPSDHLAGEELESDGAEDGEVPTVTAMLLGEHDLDSTQAVPLVDDSEGAGDDLAARPAWADAVPDADDVVVVEDSSDPFLEELRRVTNDDPDDDEALASFLSDESADEDDRGGWFGRRR